MKELKVGDKVYKSWYTGYYPIKNVGTITEIHLDGIGFITVQLTTYINSNENYAEIVNTTVQWQIKHSNLMDKETLDEIRCYLHQ